MERSHRLLLVLGLLAALLPAAAATFGTTQPEPGAPCEPTLLATQVSLFCAPDMPTAQCCEPVVASVDLGGGIPCLCRVAAEPQLVMAGLNATHLLTLYTSCGGLRHGGAHLAAACEESTQLGPAPPAFVKAPSHQLAGGAVGSSCRRGGPKDVCCSSLAAAISPTRRTECMCALANDVLVIAVGLELRDIIEIYTSCINIRAGDIHFPAGGCAGIREGATPDETPPAPEAAAPSPAQEIVTPPARISRTEVPRYLIPILAAVIALLAIALMSALVVLWYTGKWSAGRRRGVQQPHSLHSGSGTVQLAVQSSHSGSEIGEVQSPHSGNERVLTEAHVLAPKTGTSGLINEQQVLAHVVASTTQTPSLIDEPQSPKPATEALKPPARRTERNVPRVDYSGCQ